MGSDSIPLWIVFFICVIGGAYFATTESSFAKDVSALAFLRGCLLFFDLFRKKV